MANQSENPEEGSGYAWNQPRQVIQAALKADLIDVMVLGIARDGTAYSASSTANKELMLLMIKRAETALAFR
jgi:hypothetical protein